LFVSLETRARAHHDALGFSAAADWQCAGHERAQSEVTCWRGWLKAEWRCLVPPTSFCEWTDSRPKVTHWFALDESRPLFCLRRDLAAMDPRPNGRDRRASTVRVSDDGRE
jgi:hypothetical protein